MAEHGEINIKSGYDLYVDTLNKFIPPDEEWKKHGHKLLFIMLVDVVIKY